MTRLLVDCTKTYFFADGTGIQRVVQEICRHSKSVDGVDVHECLPVVFDGRRFVHIPEDSVQAHQIVRSAARLLRQLFKRVASIRGRKSARESSGHTSNTCSSIKRPAERSNEHRIAAVLYQSLALLSALATGGRLRPVAFQKRDTLLLPDATWGNLIPREAYLHVRANGVRLIPLIHDLLPIREPHTFDESFVGRFQSWLDWMLANSDAVVANSETTRIEVDKYLTQTQLPSLPVRSFQLGCDPARSSGRARPKIINQLERCSAARRFFCLGTIEPRKNHALLLNAFDMLWEQGQDVQLIIAGKTGWKCEEIIQALHSHREYGSRLQVHHDLSDAEVELACLRSDALITASIAEGLGLPVVEGLRRGMPVLASRIPAHQEAGGTHCHYFSPNAPEELVDLITTFLSDQHFSERVSPPDFRWPTWRESVDQLQSVVAELLRDIDSETQRTFDKAA